MSLTLRATLLAVCFSVCANAQTRVLALYAGPVRGLDSEAGLFMRSELQRLLLPAGIDVVWKSLVGRKAGERFDVVAVSSFEGSCSRDKTLAAPIGGSLADTSIADGHILPFFRIDCTRLIGMLGSQVEPAVLGRALARLVAHEIYHIIAETTEHQKSGVAKAVFSIQDLTAAQFELDALSLTRMRPPAIMQPSDVASGNTGR